MTERYAIASREELWLDGRRTDSRLAHGEAVARGSRIDARDVADPLLLERSARAMEQLRAAMPARPGSVRLLAEARSDGDVAVMVFSLRGASVVTTPEHAARDLELLDAAVAVPAGRPVDYAGIPLLWKGGSAAVLLHEAVGHPAELGDALLSWPGWLGVHDGDADLLAGEAPRRLRRASFHDAPIARMSEVRVTQDGAPFQLPPRRIEVLLVAGGSYEPLTGVVTVTVVAAGLVRPGREPERIAPFRIVETRSAVAHALRGAAGEPERYPGVVCAREGQELIVDSYAPEIVTVFG